MRITIDSDVLDKYHLTWQEFQVLLTAFYSLDFKIEMGVLIRRGLVEKNLFSEIPPILSDNTRNLVARIILECDEKVRNTGIDFYGLAEAMQSLYPEGKKPGTTYEWRGKTEEIAQKLMTLVVKYDFQFTEEEALGAVDKYVGNFHPKDYKEMALLRNFILYTKDGEMNSMFMTLIENKENHEDKTNC